MGFIQGWLVFKLMLWLSFCRSMEKIMSIGRGQRNNILKCFIGFFKNIIMGVDRSDYVIYGYKLFVYYFRVKGIELFDDNKYMLYIEGWKGEDYLIVYDQMSGEYVVFGYFIVYVNSQGFDFIELVVNGWLVQLEYIKVKF